MEEDYDDDDDDIPRPIYIYMRVCECVCVKRYIPKIKGPPQNFNFPNGDMKQLPTNNPVASIFFCSVSICIVTVTVTCLTSLYLPQKFKICCNNFF